MMDASGSMQGDNLSIAAISFTSLAMNRDARDEYGVVLFSEKVNVFKRVDQSMHLDQAINRVLNTPRGADKHRSRAIGRPQKISDTIRMAMFPRM